MAGREEEEEGGKRASLIQRSHFYNRYLIITTKGVGGRGRGKGQVSQVKDTPPHKYKKHSYMLIKLQYIILCFIYVAKC